MTQVVPEEDLSLEGFENIDIPCEVPSFDPRYPCNRAAEWIGLKNCGHHRLICTEHKEFFVNMIALDTGWTCAACGQKGMKWLGFEPLNKS